MVTRQTRNSPGHTYVCMNTCTVYGLRMSGFYKSVSILLEGPQQRFTETPIWFLRSNSREMWIAVDKIPIYGKRKYVES